MVKNATRKSAVTDAKQPTDWESVKNEFRAGQLSNSEIARQHGMSEGTIRKRAKKEGWKKDLSQRVKQAVRTELVRDAVREPHARTRAEVRTEEEIVETAAQRGAGVIKMHRKDIGCGRAIVGVLFERLAEAAESRGELEEAVREATKGDASLTRYNALMKAISLPAHAAVLQQLSLALKLIIQLERQAYSLETKPADPAPVPPAKSPSLDALREAWKDQLRAVASP